jgi:hypothetical protein
MEITLGLYLSLLYIHTIPTYYLLILVSNAFILTPTDVIHKLVQLMIFGWACRLNIPEK